MNNVKIFTNEEFGEIRSVSINNEIWFIGKDIANILGYERSDNAIRNHVDIEDKLTHLIGASGQNRNMIIINESGLYSLILSSKMPLAKKFKRWVTSEVLPSIRRNGMFATDELLNNPDLAIKAFQTIKEERAKREKLEKTIKSDKPFTNFGKAIASSNDAILIGDYAKLLKNDNILIGQNRLFKWLRTNDYLIKTGRRKNSPKQRYLEMELFEVKETTVYTQDGDKIRTTTLITGKGQLYFIEKLRPIFGEDVKAC